jgi:5-hydroxyisourate hydrolase-like protein (transthyretin family)
MNQKTKAKHYMKLTKNLLFGICLALGILSVWCLPKITKAASTSLYLSPSTGTYKIGSTFAVEVKVNSGGVLINAADGILNFDPNQLQVLSLSKSNSIFSLWTEEPTFSNSFGSIRFGGGTPNKFSGTSGTIFTINFKSKTIGIAKVRFFSSSVLAADYKGTNVLGSVGSGAYTISPELITSPVEEYVPPENTPTAPIVSSPTHPDSGKWYSNNDPRFTWKVPEDVTGIKLLVNQEPIVIPNVFYSEKISEKQLEDLTDGVWYFHCQLQNKFGWGGISHFKFQIDTIPPNPFEIQIKEGKETTNPQPTLFFETIDETSGINYYEVKIDQEGPIKVEKPEYKLLLQALGKHTIIVKAVDKAENQMLAMAEITILPIETPIITDYPKTLLLGSILSIKGTAVPETTIKVYLQKDKKELKIGETKSDKEGRWTYIEVEPVEKGIYEVWAEARDSLGGKSKPSEKVTIRVTPLVFIRIGKLAIDYLTTIITLLVLILAIAIGIFWSWQKKRKRRKKVRKEITEAEKSLYKAFKALKEKTEEQVAKLDGKPGLNEREKKIYDDLKEALKSSERLVEKEIKGLKRELE